MQNKKRWPPKTRWRRDCTCSLCHERLEIGPADVYSAWGTPSYRCFHCAGENELPLSLLPSGGWTECLPSQRQYEEYRKRTNRGYAQEIYREPR